MLDNLKTVSSEHHKFIITIIKLGGFKEPPKKQIYRSYKNYKIDIFSNIPKANLDHTKYTLYCRNL